MTTSGDTEDVVRHIAHQMLTTRGWTTSSERESTRDARPSMLDNIAIYEGARARLLALMFAQPRARIGIRDMRVLTEYARARGVAHILLVTSAAVTTFAQQHLGEITHPDNLVVETWLRTNLLVNPLAHRLCPPMRVVSARERDTIAKKYNLAHLPRILASDIIARFCGARVGDIFEIVRAHPDGYSYTTHRVVV